ncbi:MAG: formate dehydrogenase subunit gamma [Myxococcales bacterium]|nr:formate dehydrogenase subunit gamma [Myxococcales bacterium]
MSELGIPGASQRRGPTVMDVARDREDVVVGDEIVRHKLSSRIIHWTVALFFVGALLTGMPIWSPVFGWMAYLFGGLSVCRWLHAWLGVAFSAATVVMFFFWLSDMRFDENDKKFSFIDYLKFSAAEDPNVGKYNAGQKLFFWSILFAMLLVLLTGIPLWWPKSFSWRLRQVCIVLHDVGFIYWFVAIVGHIYLGTAAEPGTFRSMTRGTVTRAWARLHHPKWFRDVTGGRG